MDLDLSENAWGPEVAAKIYHPNLHPLSIRYDFDAQLAVMTTRVGIMLNKTRCIESRDALKRLTD
jgi:hypothetical protein